MVYDDLTHGLMLIDLPQSMPGYDRFISCWVYQRHGFTVLIDPGPTYSAATLVEKLREYGVDRVDLLLLTHIHLDHGGGSAVVLGEFPSARWYCHPKGVRHVTAPDMLWKGSMDVLGEVARAYGKPLALPPERMADNKTLAEHGIAVIDTPGHAAHHVSYLAEDILFAGEAFGDKDGRPDGGVYMRPATPARFFPEVFFKSLDVLNALEPEPAVCAFAHYGAVEGVRHWCDLARNQLKIWLNEVRTMVSTGAGDVDEILLRLMKRDELFAGLSHLPEKVQDRERYYARNSIRGLMQSINEGQQ